MKQKIQWLAIVFTVASAGLAMGCGCSSEKVRLQPVREQIIKPDTCSIQQPVVVSHRTTYVSESPSCVWIPPSTSNPAYVIGNVLTAPFRLITGRSLGQPDIVSSYNTSEPMLEKRTTVTTSSKYHLNKCGLMTKKVTLRSESMLLPVGEQLTTVKVIRTKPLPMPVGEQITTIRRTEMQPVLQPVGEQTIIRTSRVYSQPSPCGCGD